MAALVLAGLLVAPAIATAGWLPAVDISAEGDFGFDQEPQVAVDASGGAVAVWPQLKGYYVAQASSKLPGGSWGPPVDLSPSGESALEPRVAMNGAGRAVAIWVQLSSQRIVEAASRTPQGSWGAAEPISIPGHSATEVDVAIDPAGNAVAVWTQYDETSDYIVEAATMSPGGGWGPAVELSKPGNNAWGPKVVIDPAGNAVVAWYRWNDADDTIVQVAEKKPGQGWGEPKDLSAEGASSHSPELAVSAERAVIVWRSDEIVEASVKEAGGSWEEPVELSEPGAGWPVVAMGLKGAALAAWSTETPDGLVVEVATLSAGGAWTEPGTISGPLLVDSAEPEVAVDQAGRAMALWRAWDGTAPVIESAAGTLGGVWGAPVTISPPEAWARHPQVAIDSAGNAAAVWKAYEPKTMQAAVFDVTDPVLTSVSVPSAARAGRSVSFAASPFDAWSLLNPVSWTFGDGAAATGPSVVHSFVEAGAYHVTVTATDAAGHSTASSARIDVTPALAISDRVVTVRKGRASLKLHCPGTAACHGSADLVHRFKRKKRRARSLSIGKTQFVVEANTRATVTIQLNRKGRKLVRAVPKKGLRTQLTGNAVESRTVLLKPAPRRHLRR